MTRFQQRYAKRRGAAIIEFCLVLPFLMFILVLVIFFGHSMVRKQKVIQADRHFAWRHAKRVDYPTDASGNPDMPYISMMQFNNEVVPSLSAGHNTPRDAAVGMVNAAAAESVEAGDFADDIVHNLLPRGQSMGVQADYPVDQIPMDRRFGTEIGDRYYREGVPWMHRDIPPKSGGGSYWHELRDHYVDDFDDQMVNANDPGGLVSRIRNLYLRAW